MIRRSVRDPFDMLCGILLMIPLAWLLSSCSAHGATVCRTCARPIAAVQAATVQPIVVASPIYARVGAGQEQQAMATHDWRTSAEYQATMQRLMQLEAWHAGYEARGAEQTPAPAEPSARPPEQFPAQQTVAAEPPPPAEPTPAIDPKFVDRFPALAANCTKCHSGPAPKGKVAIDGSVNLDAPAAAPLRDAIVRAVYRGKMPKGKPADDETFGAILAEVYAEPVAPEPVP